MGHRDFIRRGGSSAWPNELVPGAQDYQRWDAGQAALINAIDGGSWNPAKPIGIGQTGSNPNSIALSLGTAGSQFTGGAVTTLGGRIFVAGAIPPGVTPARTRTLTWHLWELPPVSKPPTYADNDVTLIQDPTRFGIALAGPELELAIPPKFIHRGATLQSMSVNYRITQRPTAAQMGGSSQLLFIPDGAGADGISLPSPAYYNGNLFPVVWAASTSFALNAYTTPTNANANGYYFKATSVSGTHTTGASEPTWPTTVGATVTDNAGANQIVWTCIGLNGIGTHKQRNDPSTFYANGQPQQLTFQSDPTAVNIWDPQANFYGITLSIKPYGLLHSVTFVWSNITSLAFE